MNWVYGVLLLFLFIYLFIYFIIIIFFFFCKSAKVWLLWLQKLERNNFSYFVFGIKLPNGSILGMLYTLYTYSFV